MIKTHRYTTHRHTIKTRDYTEGRHKKSYKKTKLNWAGDSPQKIDMCLNCSNSRCNGNCERVRGKKDEQTD